MCVRKEGRKERRKLMTEKGVERVPTCMAEFIICSNCEESSFGIIEIVSISNLPTALLEGILPS